MPRRLRVSRRAPQAGFTLLQLSIVIGVAGILSAIILPDFIEASRTKMVQKAAEDVALIHEAARWFHRASGQPGFSVGKQGPRWPGEDSVGQCALFFDQAQAQIQLHQAGFLNADIYLTSTNVYKNPWNRLYLLDVVRTVAGPVNPAQCMFRITTEVPTSVANAFVNLVPLGACSFGATPNACGPGPGGGFTRCCSMVPPPGMEAGLSWCGGTGLHAGTSRPGGVIRCDNFSP